MEIPSVSSATVPRCLKGCQVGKKQEHQRVSDQDSSDHGPGLMPVLAANTPAHSARHRTQQDGRQQVRLIMVFQGDLPVLKVH